MLVYMLLLERTRISLNEKNKCHFTDDHGRAFVTYKRKELADKLHVSESAIRDSFRELREAELIETIQIGMNNPNKIYVKKPSPPKDDQDFGQAENCPSVQAENCLSGGAKFCPSSEQEAAHPEGSNLSANINNNKNDYINGLKKKDELPSLIDSSHSDEIIINSYYLPITIDEWEKLEELCPDDAYEIYRTAHCRARDSGIVQDFDFVLEVAKQFHK